MCHSPFNIPSAGSLNKITCYYTGQDEKYTMHICLLVFHCLPCNEEEHSSICALVPPFLFGDTKLKAKHAVPHQFAASHLWRQKLDAIGLTGYRAGFCQAQLSLIFLGGGGNIKPLSHCIFSLKNVFCNIQIAEAWCEF